MCGRVYKIRDIYCFMVEDCIFCEVVAGRSPSTKFYEDEDFVVIKNIYPVIEGHLLVVSKKHYDSFLDMPSELYGKALIVAKKVSEKEEIKDFNLVVNQGRIAGQIISHFHLHILPRKDGDGFRFMA